LLPGSENSGGENGDTLQNSSASADGSTTILVAIDTMSSGSNSEQPGAQEPDNTNDQNGQSTEDDTNDENGQSTGDDTNGENSQPTGDDTNGETDQPTEGDTNGENAGPTGPVAPEFAAGSDLARIYSGIVTEASDTLIALNRAISSGEELSERQEQCLGGYEEGLGDPLLAIGCESGFVSITDSGLRMRELAFYNTEACRASLAALNTQGCVLQNIALSIPTEWQLREEGVPFLAFAGVELGYIADESLLSIANSRDALQGVFECEIDHSSESPLVLGTNLGMCDFALTEAADQITELQSQ